MQTALIVLAAGMGTRMQSDAPKVLHQIAGAPMIAHVLKAAAPLQPTKTIVITGHGADTVESTIAELEQDAICVRQVEQLGTGHAVDQARATLAGFEGLALVLFGDTPFLSPRTLKQMVNMAASTDLVVLGFEPKDPGRYGRLIMRDDMLDRIVEFKDASDEEKKVTLCNGGLLACNSAIMFELISELDCSNASGEYYLTDLVKLARARNLTTGVVTCSEDETIGINTRAQLAQAEAYFQTRARAALLDQGVTLTAPDSVHLAFDTVIGRDSIIEPNVVFGPGVTIESGARIRAHSHLEGCHVSRGATVGPFARLRPGAEISEDVHIGNFVEIKAAQIDEGAKINHLSYVGDAHVGSNSNIGAGTITCNYDGVSKHQTDIGQNVFIGSNTMLVAPVTVGDNAVTASGTVLTQDVPADALAISRVGQVNKTGIGRKLMDSLRLRKSRREKGS
ncbi:MAG: bifunctional UDP-N-acetylglucosamine diphosphorylase/glucosamine-1-phosphate N-acetyltransferase GlmU [Pseudomonadota bacterium]